MCYDFFLLTGVLRGAGGWIQGSSGLYSLDVSHLDSSAGGMYFFADLRLDQCWWLDSAQFGPASFSGAG